MEMESIIIVLGFIVIFVNICISFIYFRNLNTLQHVTNEIAEKGYFNKWKIENALTEAVCDKFSSIIRNQVSKKERELIDVAVNEAVKQRVIELSHELAQKYTMEHFEEELKQKMSNRIGDDISSNLLGFNSY